MTRLVWTPQALADVEAIRDYIRRDSPRYAEMAVARIILAVGQGHEKVELGFFLQIDGALLGEVLLGERPCLASPSGKTGLDPILHREIPAIRVPQEYQAQDGQEVFVAGVVGVRTERIRRTPEALLYGFDVFELRRTAAFLDDDGETAPEDATMVGWRQCVFGAGMGGIGTFVALDTKRMFQIRTLVPPKRTGGEKDTV